MLRNSGSTQGSRSEVGSPFKVTVIFGRKRRKVVVMVILGVASAERAKVVSRLSRVSRPRAEVVSRVSRVLVSRVSVSRAEIVFLKSVSYGVSRVEVRFVSRVSRVSRAEAAFLGSVSFGVSRVEVGFVERVERVSRAGAVFLGRVSRVVSRVPRLSRPSREEVRVVISPKVFPPFGIRVRSWKRGKRWRGESTVRGDSLVISFQSNLESPQRGRKSNRVLSKKRQEI